MASRLRPLRPRRKRQIHPYLEGLEIRITPAVFQVVASTTDGAVGSLRDAINQSDANGDADNTINLAAGSYSLTDTGSGDLQIDDQAGGVAAKMLTISGVSAGSTIIDAGQLQNRVFQIVSSQGAAVRVLFQNVTVQGGAASDGAVLGGSVALGGGFLIDGGQVTLSSVSVKSNRVGATGPGNTSEGGGVSAGAAGNGVIGVSGRGGGIYLASGTLTLSKVQVSNNGAYGGAGGAGGLGFISASDNRTGGDGGAGGSADGGGLYIAGGSAMVVGSTFTGNQAIGGRGGLGGSGGLEYGGGNGGAGGAADGGGIDLAEGGMTLKTSDLGTNLARGGLGGLGGSGGSAFSGANGAAGSAGKGTTGRGNGNPGSKGGAGNAGRPGGDGGDGSTGGIALGGGLYVGTGTITLATDQFGSNKAEGGSGGIGGAGGAGGTGGAGGSGGSGAFGATAPTGGKQAGGDGGQGGTGGQGGAGGAAGQAGFGGTGGNAAGGAIYFAAGTLTDSGSAFIADDADGGAGGSGGRGGHGGDGGRGGYGGYGGGGGVGGEGTVSQKSSRSGGAGGQGGSGGAGGVGGFAAAGGAGGQGGAGGTAEGGGLYIGAGATTLVLSTDDFESNNANAGAGGPGGAGGAGGAGAGGYGGRGGSGGAGGAGFFGTGHAGGVPNPHYSGGNGGSGGVGGKGGKAGPGGSAGPAGPGGTGGYAAGGAVYAGGGNVTFSGITLHSNQAVGGGGGPGGRGGLGGAALAGGAGGAGGDGGAGGSAGPPGVTTGGGVIGLGAKAGDGGNGGSGNSAGAAGAAQEGGAGGDGGPGGSASGGGIFVTGGSIAVEGSTLDNNNAQGGGGGAGGQGGIGGGGMTNDSASSGRGGVGGSGGRGGNAGHVSRSTNGNIVDYANTAGKGGGGARDGAGDAGGQGGSGGNGGRAGKGGTAYGGGLFISSGAVALTADTVAYNVATGGAGGDGGAGGVGGNGGSGGLGGLVAASSTATNMFTYNDGGDGGSLPGLSSNAQRRAGEPGSGGPGGNGGAGGNGGTGGLGGNGSDGGDGGMAAGGGIYLAAGSLTTLNSTIAINSAQGGAGGDPGQSAQGGAAGRAGPGGRAGIGGLADAKAGAQAASGTIGTNGAGGVAGGAGAAGLAGNAAGASGGAISVSGGTATLDNSTVALNTGGAGASASGGTMVAISTIFAGNGSLDYQGNINATDSLFQTAPAGTVSGSGNVVGVDPLLATQGLVNNGGTTDTIALQPGSPALGAGANPQHVLTDQRGAPRTGAGGTDIGAYQSGPASDTQAPTASLQAAAVSSSNASTLNPYTFTITYTDNLAIKKTSLAATVVQVSPPGIGSPIVATVINTAPEGSTDAAGDAQSFVVTYQMTPPGGSWSESDNGVYRVNLVSSPPTDLAGNPVVSGSVGSFTVEILGGTLSVTAQPSTPVVAGAAFGLTVEAKDNQGQVIPGFNQDVTLSVAIGQVVGTLYGTVTTAAVNGVATFTGLSLERAGSGYTITAACSGLTSATSGAISVTAASATTLSISVQPPTSVTGNTQFEVDVLAKDPFGNVAQSFTGPVSIAVSNGPQDAGLGGRTSVNAVDGVAAFSDLTLNAAGTGYTLQATGGNVAAATTAAFAVTAEAALEFAVGSESVDETTAGATIDVERGGGYQGAVSVDVATSGGSAVAGVNYTAVSTVLNFPAGQNSETITIPLLNEGLIPDLTLNVVLSNPGSGAALGSPSSNTLSIHRPPPAQPSALALVTSDDSGTKGDGITDLTAPSLTGTAEPDATVQLLNHLNVVVGSTTAQSNGKFVIAVPGAPLGPGNYNFSVVAKNAYGSSLASKVFTLTIVAAPPTPNAPALLASERYGTAGGETTTSTSPDLVGTTLPGATVRLISASSTSGSPGSVVSTTTADGSGNYDFKIPGPLAPGPYSYQVNLVDQHGDASDPSTTQTITVVPPLVTVQRVTDTMNKKHQVTQITVVFSGSVNSTEADKTTGTYRLATPGKKGSYTAKNAGIIAIRTATYIDSTHTVVLVPKKPFALTKPVQLLISGVAPTGLQDSVGRLIDGNHDGQAGGNAIAILSRAGVKPSAVELARTRGTPQMKVHAVDALLVRGERLGRRIHRG